MIRASEAILLAIKVQGGQVPATQFQEWLAELARRKYIEYVITDPGDVAIKITEPGKKWLRVRGF